MVEQSIQIVHDVVDHERRGAEIVSGGGENSPNCNVFLLRVVVFAPRKHRASAFVSQSKMLRIPFAHRIPIGGFEEGTADSKDAPALLHFDRRLRLLRLRRFHSLSSFRQAAMSNGEPSAIVLPGIPCICGLSTIRMEQTVRSRFAAIRTNAARPVSVFLPFRPMERPLFTDIVFFRSCHDNNLHQFTRVARTWNAIFKL